MVVVVVDCGNHELVARDPRVIIIESNTYRYHHPPPPSKSSPIPIVQNSLHGSDPTIKPVFD